jgi:hypothetical protein
VIKKIEMRTLLFAIAIGLVAATSANARLAVLHSTPNDLPNLSQLVVRHSTPNDLSELPHAEYFAWGIDSTLAQDEITTGAALTFANIWGWINESDNHLLDNPKSGSRSYVDHRGGGNYFANNGPLAGDWSDPIGGKPQNFNLVFDFGSLGLLDVRNNFTETTPGTDMANFGFRIDHDSNDYDNGITSTITTKTKTSITYTP